MPALIVKVERSSIADDIGLAPGDTLISIDGKEINDILDYHFWVRSEQLELSIEKADGKIWTVEIEKDYDEDLGLEFEDLLFDRIKSCQNRCVFCFIDQLPRHMRKTLYIKDDDYRHSFLFGNFITLSNLREEDWEKIITMRLSPLYISVHALQPQVRSMLMGNQRAGRIRQDLLRLSQAGIQVHTQIVLCPGLNDGQVLEETIEGLAELYPSVSSIGIVPVGLTGHRSSLPELRTLNELEALSLIELIHSYQKRFRTQLGYGLVYGADEIYLKAGQPQKSRPYGRVH
jgi:putative radical SAM enzyme (TIGR03279 family)